jgi:hypothetical protein
LHVLIFDPEDGSCMFFRITRGCHADDFTLRDHGYGDTAGVHVCYSVGGGGGCRAAYSVRLLQQVKSSSTRYPGTRHDRDVTGPDLVAPG